MICRMDEIEKITQGPIQWFRDWPVGDVPRSGALVYTIWDLEGSYIYVGMSGRVMQKGHKPSRTVQGPWGRLNSHAGGRRSGDQFCVYVCDRLVLPRIHNHLQEIADGELSLDAVTKDFIRENLGFRWVEVEDGQAALDLERQIQRGDAPCGKPFFNGV